MSPSPNFMNLEAYEPEVAWVLQRLLQRLRAPTVVDVGANYGQFLTFAKTFSPAATVHSFEPFPDLATTLDALVRVNGWSNVSVQCAAVGEEDGQVDLYFADDARACATTSREFRPNHPANRDTRTVSSVRLDTWARDAGIEKVDLLKIDVEGGELEVIRGGAALTARFRPDLLLEVLPVGRPDTVTGRYRLERARSVWEQLRPHGYRAWRVDGPGKLARVDDLASAREPSEANHLLSVRDEPFG